MAYNILVVDDSLPMRSVIKKTVKASGFNVGRFFDAPNGRDTLSFHGSTELGRRLHNLLTNSKRR